MKLVAEGELAHGRIKSEGKIIEVMPIIEFGSGQAYMLPPAFWTVENWVLGFDDHHSLRGPLQFWQNVKTTIPGSTMADPARLTHLTRVLENGSVPRAGGPIDAAAVRGLIEAIRTAPDVYPGDS